MTLDLVRYSGQKNCTLGLFFIDGSFSAYTVEDEKRIEKVKGKTRIPETLPGHPYKVTLRPEGGFHQRYLKMFGADFHRGMLCIHNSPDYKITNAGMEFQYILFHILNDHNGSDGCIGWGNTSRENLTRDGFIGDSKAAYQRVYPIIRDELLKGNAVYLNVKEIQLC